jgi:CubicO group peptidase (beta-lactamase class C family)
MNIDNMKKLLVLLFFVISRLTNAQQLSRTDELFVDSVMNVYFNPSGPGAVILIAKKGKPVLKKAYGLANIELNVINKPDYVFNIGSMSKQFTAICILKLAQNGKLKLQDDIKKYLTDYNTHGRNIKIENLLYHTSGIINYSDKEDFIPKSVTDITKEDLKKYFVNDSLFFEPNSNWSYCNSGYVLAGLIVEKVSGKSLTEYLTDNIFKPCEMSNTFVGNDDSVFVNSVSGYDNVLGHENTEEAKYKPAQYMSWTYSYGAGGIISTVDDLLKYNNALLSEKIITKEWLDKAWNPSTLPNGKSTNYGLGWAVGTYQGLKFVAHGGGLNGFRSYGVLFPNEQIYLVILSNTSAKTPVTYASPIAFKIAGKPLPNIKGINIDKKTLEEYKGVYSINSPAHDFLPTQRFITVKDNNLFAQLKEGEDLEEVKQLYYIDKDFFAIKNSPQKFQFIRDKKGKVTSIEVYNFPIQYGPFETNLKTELALPNN